MRACAFLAALPAVVAATAALAEAGGPDYWRVTGVAAGDQLMVHPSPSARSAVIGKLAHDANGIRNRGCTGVPSFGEWQRMSAAQRERSARARWCRIENGSLKGWVAGRFLAEGHPPGSSIAAAPVTAGAWTVVCGEAGCYIEQKGIAANKPTVLRIEPDGPNARIAILRSNPPRSGMLGIYMDGDLITEGPLAQQKRTALGIVMEPDDITLGLLKQMRRHANLVLSLPGEERGVEFHVEKLAEALQELERLRKAR
jgi:hypothetical protein